jgi:predicted TIM-barrel fold metal-dependent hydrolase
MEVIAAEMKRRKASGRTSMIIIDCHCHAGKGDGLHGPWDTDAPLGDFMRWSRRAGIHRTNLFGAFHTDYAVANRQVARIIAARPDLFYGFAFVHARRDAGRIANMVKTAVRQFGFRGIKVHRVNAPISREVCETARALALPVLYDINGEVSQIDLLATEYPTVNFIIPHLGSFGDNWRVYQAMIDPLTRHPNIYCDTSAVIRFDVLRKAVQRAGPRKFLFGSDGPWLHPGVELAKVRALIDDLKLKPAEQQMILGGNFLRLLGRREKSRHPLQNGNGAAGVSRGQHR